MKAEHAMPSFKIQCNKRVCFWGAAQDVPKSVRLVDQAMTACGANTGNLFIGNGLFKALEAPIKSYWDFYDKSPAEFDELYDVLFVPASNFIFENTDLTLQYEFFSKTKAQIFMFGLGSQARQLKPIKLQKGTENFIKLVEDRSGSIGVRGEFTAEIMASMGYKNIDIVGCPSMLSIPSAFKSWNTRSPSLVMGSFSNNARDHAFDHTKLAAIESYLFRELVRIDGYYVLQNERHELAISAIADIKSQFDDEDIFHINKVKSLFSLSESIEQVAAYLARRAKIFFDVGEWIRFSSQMELSFGTRFHGNVAALLGGTPVFIFCHDFRTLELCRLYNIPHCDLNDSFGNPTISEIYSRACMIPFQNRYRELCDVWASFVRKNGFTSSCTEEY